MQQRSHCIFNLVKEFVYLVSLRLRRGIRKIYIKLYHNNKLYGIEYPPVWIYIKYNLVPGYFSSCEFDMLHSISFQTQ